MITIKRLKVGDEAVAKDAIQNLKSETSVDVLAKLDTEYLREFLSCERNYFLVAFMDEQPLGFVLAYRLMRVDRDQDMMLFYEIVVREENRNKGVGALLISELKKICRANNILKMWVLTNESNLAAMALYERTGGIKDESGDEVSFTYFPDFV